MDFLKKLFPLSFGATDKDNFIKALVIYIAALVVLTVVGMLLGGIIIIGTIIGIIGYVVDVYATAGIVLSILVFTKVIKQ